MLLRAIPSAAVLHLVHRESEEEHVLLDDFSSHLDGGAVARGPR